jgi:hypothetical protein
MFEAIRQFLKIFDFSEGIPNLANVFAEFEVYFYPPIEFTRDLLIRDHREYLAKRDYNLQPRRVAYMVLGNNNQRCNKKSPIILYNDSLANVCPQNTECTIVILEYINNAIKCWILTTETNEQQQRLYHAICSTISEFMPLISAISHQVRIQNSIEIILAEITRSLLISGKIQNIDVPKTIKDYHDKSILLLKNFLTKLVQKSTNNNESEEIIAKYKQIIKSFEVLLKYNIFLSARVFYKQLPFEFKELEALSVKNSMLKNAVYKLSFEDINVPEIFAPYKKFLLEQLLTLYRDQDDLDAYINYVEKIRESKYNELIVGDNALSNALKQAKNNWKAYRYSQIKQLLGHAYEHSLVGMFSKLLYSLSSTISANKYNVIAGYIGALLGVYLMFIVDNYFLLRILGTNFLIAELQQRMPDNQLDDANAKVIGSYFSILNTINAVRIAQSSIALAESLYMRDPVYVVRVLGSLLVSFLAIQLALRIDRYLNNPVDQNVCAKLQLYETWGSIIGFYLSGILYSKTEKIATRAKFKKQFCQHAEQNNYSDCSIVAKQSLNSFSFWFKRYDEVTMQLRKNDQFSTNIYTTTCQVVKIGEVLISDCSSYSVLRHQGLK